MIYIRLDPSKIPPEWLEKAKELAEDLEKIDDAKDRSEFIKEHDIWREIKGRLLEMSHGKCWYSEAPDAVSDWHVDHFRPKASYQWLAFDWQNFRVCGAIPNRTKRDEFPLPQSSPRATWESRDCSCECCLLLDPTNPTDPALITFDETGVPIASNPNWPIANERVELTTKLLELDSPRLKEARQRRWRDCLSWITELTTLLPKQLHELDDARQQQITRIMNTIRIMTMPNEPYSAVARACVRASGFEQLVAGPEHAEAA